MSEVETITGGATGTIYGTFAGATNYHGASGSDAAVAYRGLANDDERKRKLIDSTRYLNRFGYATGYTTFALRDVVDLGTGDGDAAFPFRAACYELAGLAAVDSNVLAAADQGSNIKAVSASGASVEYFSPTSVAQGTASLLPPTVLALIGPYLAVNADALDQGGGTGATGSCENPFGPCADYERREPY